MGTWPALAIPCSPCLARKGQSWEHGRGARYGLSPLPVKQKAISRLPRKALGIFGGSARDGLFLCLSTKRQFHRSHGGPLDSSAGVGGSARDGLSPLSIEENAISGLPQKRPGGPQSAWGDRGQKLQ